MTSEVLEMMGNVVIVQGVIGISLSKAAYTAIRVRFPTVESLLEACSKDLEKIKTRFNEVPADRREIIHNAVERHECKSLEELEEDLQKLLDNHNELSYRYKKSSYWERNTPYSRLRTDIDDLKEAARELLSDTRNTTSTWLVRDQAQSPRSGPPVLPLPPAVPIDLPRWNTGLEHPA